MKHLTLQRPSLAEYFALIESQPAGLRHIFRGQSDASWPLVPSLYRTRPDIVGGTLEENFGVYEWSGISRFFDEALLYLPNIRRSPTDDRILAQHFGVPTRLLDWSFDPMIALFFAVERRQDNVDAAVYMLLPSGMMDPESISNANMYPALAIRPPAIDRRIPAQKSVFTWHPYGPAAEPFVPIDQRSDVGGKVTDHTEKPVGGFAKILVPKDIRQHIRHLLLEMGIDRRNLFPGLDGVGAHVADGVIWA